MKLSHIGTIILIAGLGLSASAANKICKALLTQTSMKAQTPIALPKGDLVYYYQHKGLDPFNLFQEGMDPANENPLSVRNGDRGLDISIGGGNFENGKDGANNQTVKALEYSDTRQRYLVQVVGKGHGYRLLVNVDTQAGTAHVYMQEKKLGWSDWALAAVYSSDPAEQQKLEDEEAQPEPPKVVQPNRAVENPTVSSGKSYDTFGLFGYGERDEPQLLMINKMGALHKLIVYNGSTIFSSMVAQIELPENVCEIIASGNLAKLDGIKVKDKSGASVQFKVNGYDFKMRPRVRVTGESESGEAFDVKSCNPWQPGKVSF